MEKEDRLEFLLQSKTFDDMTSLEKDFVLKEVGSEEQFLALKKVHQELVSASAKNILPAPRILPSLKLKLKQKNRKEAVWMSVVKLKISAPVSLTLVIIACFVTWFFSSASPVLRNDLIVKTVKYDTIYVQSKPDTIKIDRVVTRYVNIAEKKENETFSVAKTRPVKSDSILSVRMSEQEGLDDLLVSGTF
jgi:hypothetical protein